MPPDHNKVLALTPADELMALPMLQSDRVTDPLTAYQISKRGNALRVAAQAIRWGGADCVNINAMYRNECSVVI